MEAGAIAGLAVERIINEPTAAALAYGYGLGGDEHLRVLVYDLGGGTFDVSLIELHSGVVDVLATAGDNHLGGDDFDERLANLIADEFAEEYTIDLRQDHQAWARLLRAAEETKIALSDEPYATMTLEYIAHDRRQRPLHIVREVSRVEFVELIADLLERTVTCMDQVLNDAHVQPGDIDRVLLVGGSTRIPAVWELVSGHMEQTPHDEIDPDAVVALGAAVQAGIIAGEAIDAVLVDVTPLVARDRNGHYWYHWPFAGGSFCASDPTQYHRARAQKRSLFDIVSGSIGYPRQGVSGRASGGVAECPAGRFYGGRSAAQSLRWVVRCGSQLCT